MKRIADGEILGFDKNLIQLKECILGQFREDNIQDIVENHGSTEIYNELYGLSSTREFLNYFESLLKVLKEHFGTDRFYYQKIPSFRIHRVGGKSVNYHNDCMYGHGKKVINVWLPLVAPNKHNALWISDIANSKKLVRRFNDEKLSISQANNLFKEHCAPVIMDYGQILLFNTSTIHGTEANNSNSHRLSFDFRILPYGEHPGTKKINEFYKAYNDSNEGHALKEKCLFYVYKNNPLMENCSHSAQRQLLEDYAMINNLDSEGLEETEIYGVNHYPNILHYLNKGEMKNIVLPSILCLPKDKETRNKILVLAGKKQIELHFCLENQKASGLRSGQVHHYYDQVQMALNYII